MRAYLTEQIKFIMNVNSGQFNINNDKVHVLLVITKSTSFCRYSFVSNTSNLCRKYQSGDRQTNIIIHNPPKKHYELISAGCSLPGDCNKIT